MKAKLMKAFKEMKENCEMTAQLYQQNLVFNSWSEAYNRIDDILATFRNMISGLYIYDLISEEMYNYFFDMSANISAVNLLH